MSEAASNRSTSFQIVQRRLGARVARHGIRLETVHGARRVARAVYGVHREDDVATLHVGQHVQRHAADVHQRHVLGDVIAGKYLVVGRRATPSSSMSRFPTKNTAAVRSLASMLPP